MAYVLFTSWRLFNDKRFLFFERGAARKHKNFQRIADELAGYCQSLERGAKGGRAAHLHPEHAGSADLLGIYAGDAGSLGGRRIIQKKNYGRLSAGADDDAAAHSIVRTLCARTSHRTPGQCGRGGVSSAARSLPLPC